MTTQFVSVMSLPRLADVLAKRESSIQSLVNSLKIADVRREEDFQASKQRIKNQVLLKPVSFGEPSVIDYQYSERALSFVEQMSGFSRNVYTFEVAVSFSGDSDLITHSCATPSFTSSERGIVQPNWSGTITLYVPLEEDAPEQAIEQAKQDLAPTVRNAGSNNITVENWNLSMESMIDRALNAKRSNLIQTYGA